jgi:hypothetical protein
MATGDTSEKDETGTTAGNETVTGVGKGTEAGIETQIATRIGEGTDTVIAIGKGREIVGGTEERTVT